MQSTKGSLLVLLLLTSVLVPPRMHAQLNFTVNSLADDDDAYPYDDPDTPEDESIDGICNDAAGRCTLGAAIGEASNMGVPVDISFSVSGTINLMNPMFLPDGSTIDGEGKIELTSPYACLSVDNDCTVLRLKFSGASFGFGLSVGGKNNTIGGFDNGNEFVACQIGLVIEGDSNKVYGNYVGIDRNNVLMPNGFGMLISGSNNTIGKPTAGFSNKVCGNTVVGIEISLGGNNEVSFNYIGTTTNGLSGYGNKQGILIAGSDGNIIGGDSPIGRNIISGNTEYGVLISGAPPESYSSINIIRNNTIGLSPDEATAIPNGNGIVITDGARYDIIESNVIAGNTQTGILLFGINDSIDTNGHIIDDNTIGVNGSLNAFPNQVGIAIRGNATSISIGADVSNNHLPNRIVDNQQGGIVLIPEGGFSPNHIWFRKNIINQNVVTNLSVDPSANLGIQPPSGLSFSGNTLAGIHQLANVVIDVYEANKFEGPPSAYQWLGSTTTNGSGVFAFDITNTLVEAVAVTASASSMGTSSFAYHDIVTGIDDEVKIPTEFSLKQNYPNPFNPSTTILYSLPKEELVSLIIFNALGEQIAQLVNEKRPAGNHSASFAASDLATGVYFYRISAGSFTQTRKMAFVK